METSKLAIFYTWKRQSSFGEMVSIVVNLNVLVAAKIDDAGTSLCRQRNGVHACDYWLLVTDIWLWFWLFDDSFPFWVVKNVMWGRVKSMKKFVIFFNSHPVECDSFQYHMFKLCHTNGSIHPYSIIFLTAPSQWEDYKVWKADINRKLPEI